MTLFTITFNVLRFNFVLVSLCLKLLIIHYHTQKQRKIKLEPRIKLNHSRCIDQRIDYAGAS